MQDKYSKSGIACFLKEDDSFWDPTDDERMLSPCWQVKWQLRQFVRKVSEPLATSPAGAGGQRRNI